MSDTSTSREPSAPTTLHNAILVVCGAAIPAGFGLLLDSAVVMWASLGVLAVCIIVGALSASLFTHEKLSLQLQRQRDELAATEARFDKLLQRLQRQIDAQHDFDAGDRPRVLLNRELQQREAEIDAGDIWIITREISGDMLDEDVDGLRTIMTKNIVDRGTTYVYLVPDATRFGEVFERKLRGTMDRTKLLMDRIAESDFPAPPGADRVIYNPKAKPGLEDCIAYFQYPEELAKGQTAKWGEVRGPRALEWAEEVREIVEGLEAAARE
jgi:hypothetical protein